ncbi:MAG: hypothetical protein RIC19_18980 [Phaeodactylibacter sp.]|uniref:hypothetical protein n=1 Tax=Phaeodactylibacter sp. TaxID=1940289 RepID=UPI0032EF5368
MSRLLIFLWLALPIGLNAQDSLFAFVDNPFSGRFAPKLVTSYKLAVVQRIFDDLVEARGSFRMPVPELVMNNGRRYMAWMHPGKRQIGLEEQAYDICVSLGPDSLNALAAMLSHEIIHYYENHDWKRNFINQNEGLEAAARLEELSDGLKYETQADYFGGILALSAGYNTYSTLSPLLVRAYEAYGLPKEIQGYPSLDERLKLSENTARQLEKLFQVYQTANYLSLIGGYADALQYYQFILGEYQGFELYNNAGATALLAALELTPKAEIPFVLPIELDLESRLAQITTRIPKDADARRAALLEQGQQMLKNALLLDEEQPSAHLNLANLHLLKGEWLDAEYRARKALAIAQAQADPMTKANAMVTLGVAAVLQRDTARATEHFKSAQSAGAALAKINLSVLQGGAAVVAPQSYNVKGVEEIAAIFPEDFLIAPAFTATVNLPGKTYCGYKNMPQSSIFQHYVDDGSNRFAWFHRTGPAYEGHTLKGLEIGASEAEIRAVYGQPNRVLSLSEGQCLAYDQRNLLLLTNDQSQLISWIVFRANL